MENKKIFTVITGASSGIGYEAAKAFASRKKNLIIIARREERLCKLKEEINLINNSLEVVVKAIDLSNSSNCYSLYDDLKKYKIETWINSAGFGNYDSVDRQDLGKIETMIQLNINALTILSSLFVSDYKGSNNTQLINISSAGGYTIVPNAVTYCASKFYVSAFTEGLARELILSNAKLRAKVLAPAATKTEFGKVASNVVDYDYDKAFGMYHSSEEMARYLLNLYDSDKTVGIIDRQNFEFSLSNPKFNYAGNPKNT